MAFQVLLPNILLLLEVSRHTGTGSGSFVRFNSNPILIGEWRHRFYWTEQIWFIGALLGLDTHLLILWMWSDLTIKHTLTLGNKNVQVLCCFVDWRVNHYYLPSICLTIAISHHSWVILSLFVLFSHAPEPAIFIVIMRQCEWHVCFFGFSSPLKSNISTSISST